jgi:hypothetical protein
MYLHSRAENIALKKKIQNIPFQSCAETDDVTIVGHKSTLIYFIISNQPIWDFSLADALLSISVANYLYNL